MNDPKHVLIRGCTRSTDGLRFWGFARSGTERWVSQHRFNELQAYDQEAEKLKKRIDQERIEKLEQGVAKHCPKSPAVKAADRREYMKTRRQYDAQFRTAERLRSRLKSALSRKPCGTNHGINTKEILSWFRWLNENGHAPKWPSPEVHIDHVIPICAFDVLKKGAASAINNWRNLMPISAKSNIKKGNKIDPIEIRRVWRLADQYTLEMKTSKAPAQLAEA
jgi:hypothetical protein